MTSTEEILAIIWEEVLDVADVTEDDHFFELGGDSLLAVTVVSKARRAGLTMTVKQAMDNAVLRDLGRAVT